MTRLPDERQDKEKHSVEYTREPSTCRDQPSGAIAAGFGTKLKKIDSASLVGRLSVHTTTVPAPADFISDFRNSSKSDRADT